MLCEDVENCDELINSIPDIETLFQRQTTSEVQALLDEYLSSDVTSENGSSEKEKYNAKDAVDGALKNFMNQG
tara:strand:- start:1238 stop:1456 length:219 start_codon:yes stop_codon:yes gene_type:complete